MNVSYKGVQKELPAKLQKKLDARFAKLGKLLEVRGEREAHVVVTSERHLHKAEISLQFYDHQLVGLSSDGDLFAAMSGALEKLEKQALKQRTKWRAKQRRPEPVEAVKAQTIKPKPAKPEASSDKARGPQRVFAVNHHERRKPMTLEEALMEMETGRDYVVYRDAEKQCVSVLVRRPDGNFDLIDS